MGSLSFYSPGYAFRFVKNVVTEKLFKSRG